ncbi:MAG: AsmA family protein [Cytophagaceae bacterium]|nr:AsmA family protein [Cytophagaceae bacterium]
MMPRKILKITLIIFSTLLLIAGLGAGLAWMYRDELFRQIQAHLNQQLNGSVSARDVRLSLWSDGPGLTLTLTDVRLRDTRYQRDLLAVGQVAVRLDVLKLLSREVSVRSLRLSEGAINIFVDKNGYTNLSIFGPKDSKDSTVRKTKSDGDPFLLGLQKIQLRNVRASFIDSTKGKRYAARFTNLTQRLSKKGLSWEEPTWARELRGQVFFEGLTFNARRGAFVKNTPILLDLNWSYQPATKRLTVAPSTLRLTEKQDSLRVQGHFMLKLPVTLDLEFQTGSVPLATVANWLTPNISSKLLKFKVNPNVRAWVRLSGSTAQGATPRIEARAQVDTFTYQQSVMGPIDRVKLRGTFTNKVDTTRETADANSRILVPQLQGFYQGIPLTATFEYADLTRSDMTMNLAVNTDLLRLNPLLDDARYRFGGGKLRAQVRYRGDFSQTFNGKTGSLHGLFSGSLFLQNGSFMYTPRRVHLTNVHGQLTFNQSDLFVKNLTVTANQSPMTIQATLRQLVPFLNGKRATLEAQARVTSPRLNLNQFSFQTVKSTAKTSPNRTRRQLAATIDRVIDDLKLDLQLSAESFHYRNLTARQLRANLLVTKKLLHLRNVSMGAFGGQFGLTGRLDYLDQSPSRLNVRCQVSGADVREIFRTFENFGQTSLTDRQINGTWSSNGTFRANLTSEYRIVPASMAGDLNIQLRDGELINFEPLKRVQKFIFKNRDFNNVRFATITNRFRLRGVDIDVDQMEVESSVLTLFLKGVYSFQDRTNLRIQVPLSNLRKRGADYQLTQHDPSKGANIYLSAVDEGGEVKIQMGRRTLETAPALKADSVRVQSPSLVRDSTLKKSN